MNDRPRALYGIDYQGVAHRSSGRQQHMKPGKVLLNVVIRLVPRALAGDARREIPLCLSLHRIPAEVRTADIGAKQRLPIPDLLV